MTSLSIRIDWATVLPSGSSSGAHDMTLSLLCLLVLTLPKRLHAQPWSQFSPVEIAGEGGGFRHQADLLWRGQKPRENTQKQASSVAPPRMGCGTLHMHWRVPRPLRARYRGKACQARCMA